MPLAPILSSVREHLIGQNLNVQLVGDGEAITANMDLKNLRILLAFAVQRKSKVVQIESFLPVRIPEGRRPAVLDLLSRVNWTIRTGRFVVDLTDGEVRFRVEAEHEDTARIVSRVEERMLLSCLIIDTFFPAMMEVVFGNKDPKAAMEEAEAAAGVALEERRSLEHAGESTEEGDGGMTSDDDGDDDDDGEDRQSFGCEDVGEGEGKGEAEAPGSPVSSTPSAPVVSARQVLAAWVPKCPPRPVFEEAGLLFYYEHGYRIHLSGADAEAVRDLIRSGGSTDGEASA